MVNLTRDYIRDHVADTPVIFKRGTGIYSNGAFVLREMDQDRNRFVYEVDGTFGDDVTQVRLADDHIESACTCPYPGIGCKHTVAALPDVQAILSQWQRAADSARAPEDPYLSAEQIKAQAIDDRRKRAKSEAMELTEGEMRKGQHLVQTALGRQNTVTLHDPEKGRGHCTCPDYLTNHLGICKHLIFAADRLKKKRRFTSAGRWKWQRARRSFSPGPTKKWCRSTGKPAKWFCAFALRCKRL